MSCFGFVVHPLNLEHLYKTAGYFSHLLRRAPAYVVKNLLRSIPPYKFIHLKHLSSIAGKEIEGYIIICPLLPDQIANYKNNIAKDKILAACRLAKRFGAQIVGLGGFNSIIGNGGEEIAKNVDVAVTSGNTYTASLVIDGLLKAANFMRIDLGKATVAVIGASGDIGSICSKMLVSFVPHLIFVARDEQRLETLKHSMIQRNSYIDIKIVKDINDAVKNADIVLTVTSAITTIIEPGIIKPGAVLCDVSYPANINMELAKKRKDVLVFEGGLAQSQCFNKINAESKRKIGLFNSRGTIHGCVSETMLLTFENRIENFSLGRGNITIEKINIIREIAKKHGFEVAAPPFPLKSV